MWFSNSTQAIAIWKKRTIIKLIGCVWFTDIRFVYMEKREYMFHVRHKWQMTIAEDMIMYTSHIYSLKIECNNRLTKWTWNFFDFVSHKNKPFPMSLLSFSITSFNRKHLNYANLYRFVYGHTAWCVAAVFQGDLFDYHMFSVPLWRSCRPPHIQTMEMHI